MLTAWDKPNEKALALPDFEDPSALKGIRERTRQGQLVCPTCLQPLWLHSGKVRIAHFAHRILSNCPHGRVSEAVLLARRQIYRFFQARIEGGKLSAEIQLEPVVPELPKDIQFDLVLRRQKNPSVAILLLEANLKPDRRERFVAGAKKQGWIFRPVFLVSRFKHMPEDEKCFLLDTTQREFRLPSPYDLSRASHPGTLHFVETKPEKWLTLRGLSPVHDPQGFKADAVRSSTMEQLLWSEAHAEWVHPGEAEAFRARRQKLKQREQERSKPRESPPPPPIQVPNVIVLPPIFPVVFPRDRSRPKSPPPSSDPLPAWVRGALRCVGCGQETKEWQNARPVENVCVCRKCFEKGIRLPRS